MNHGKVYLLTAQPLKLEERSYANSVVSHPLSETLIFQVGICHSI